MVCVVGIMDIWRSKEHTCDLYNEKRIKVQRDFIEEQSLNVSNVGRGGGRGRGIFLVRGHAKGRKSRESVECYKFHKLGDYQSECDS